MRALFCLTLILSLLSPLSADLITIADYRDDFNPNTPSEGWAYLWNRDGVIGNTANYTALLSTGSGYDSNGVNGLPDPLPGRFVTLTQNFGHPGPAPAQGVGFDVHAIAAFTVDQAGEVFIANSNLSMTNGNRAVGSDTLALLIHVNNGPAIFQQSGFDSTTFDISLGELETGDTVFVAIGPNGSDFFDGFALDFSLLQEEAVPEPSSWALLLIGLGLSGFTRRTAD